MKQLNFNHLQYFYAVAREGSVTRAAQVLNVTPQTVSGQLATFEEYIGAPLFTRQGKRLEPNSLGQITLRYADDIFNLGSELSRTLASHDTAQVANFNVGVVDAIPKVMAFEMLNDCFDLENSFVIECHEGDLSSLLADLSVNKLDLIISDQPLPVGVSVRAINNYLGQTGVTFFARKEECSKYLPDFPESLNRAPFLMPGKNSALHQNLESWFVQSKISPKIVAEFEDSALLKFFGQTGRGIFCVATAVERDVLDQFDVGIIGRITEVSDRIYGISPERKIKHPAVDIVLKAAQRILAND
ncbi:transcriptional activator NhaR [Arenicella sp. 4NH20-0111]|uniref:transcriptional activator NhaR n=1 Tax=Arenicella sp. 4NH20-0111 TaxID=3127648 RepID=UPI0033407C09